MITEKDNVFYCDCGFSFQRGRSGAHDCADGLRNKLVESESRCAALAAENVGLKEWIPNPHSASMFEATDAFLAEVRAQESKRVYESILDNPAVTDMESLVDWLEQNANDSVAFAAQLRKGVQS
ncbi:hypothetical protein [Enterobacter hormaechei]|uniref:hypothetical protein n=1 Tax=Enterobacter hormaechei TaxID=158836 RepID=UPI0022F13ACC|nr:hypothetical protein [Enterobacter hormaechei]MDA4840601.1 hypothetical protein [Enterobacter hormaechei]